MAKQFRWIYAGRLAGAGGIVAIVGLAAALALSFPPRSSVSHGGRVSEGPATAASPSVASTSSGAAALQALAVEAFAQAHSVSHGAFLMQVDVMWPDLIYTFGFIDADRSRLISVRGPSTDLASPRWQVKSALQDGLEYRPGPLDLRPLRVGAEEVGRAVLLARPETQLLSLTLYGSGGLLMWASFSRQSEGYLRCDTEDASGVLRPSCPYPPMQPPVVAPP
jgi:hypothetical protein